MTLLYPEITLNIFTDSCKDSLALIWGCTCCIGHRNRGSSPIRNHRLPNRDQNQRRLNAVWPFTTYSSLTVLLYVRSTHLRQPPIGILHVRQCVHNNGNHFSAVYRSRLWCIIKHTLRVRADTGDQPMSLQHEIFNTVTATRGMVGGGERRLLSVLGYMESKVE